MTFTTFSDVISHLLSSPRYRKRATKLNISIEASCVQDPYYDFDGGRLSLKITRLDIPFQQNPTYITKQNPYTSTIKLSIMPSGCGVIVLSEFWVFGAFPRWGALHVDLIKDATRLLSRYDVAQWGRMLIATTADHQPRAEAYFRSRRWRRLETTYNPRSCHRMNVWSYKFPDLQYIEKKVNRERAR